MFFFGVSCKLESQLSVRLATYATYGANIASATDAVDASIKTWKFVIGSNDDTAKIGIKSETDREWFLWIGNNVKRSNDDMYRVDPNCTAHHTFKVYDGFLGTNWGRTTRH